MKTKRIKQGKIFIHLCPECGSQRFETTDIDVRKRNLGMQYKAPQFGYKIKCSKCYWSGDYKLPPDIEKELESEWNKIKDKKVNHVKRSMHK